jgi:hypothetical protein
LAKHLPRRLKHGRADAARVHVAKRLGHQIGAPVAWLIRSV